MGQVPKGVIVMRNWYFSDKRQFVLRDKATDTPPAGKNVKPPPPPPKDDDVTEDEEEVDDQEDLDDKKNQVPDELGFSEKQKAYIKSLRDESAKHRKKAKDLESSVKTTNDRLSKFEEGLKKLVGGEEDNLTPEEKMEKLQAQNDAHVLKGAIRDAAWEHGITKDQYDYFDFLVTKELEGLGENEELSDEKLEAIAKKAKAQGGGKPGNSSVDGKGGNDKPDPGNPDGLTLAKFKLMGIVEKSRLYQTNPDLYNQLLAEEKANKQK